MMSLINIRWRGDCGTILYFLKIAVCATLGMTYAFIFLIWNPHATPFAGLELVFSVCVGSVLAASVLSWM
jgi:hypothetical protein